jgi:threonine synthase
MEWYTPVPSAATGLSCRGCGRAYPRTYRLDCPECHSLLQVEYELGALAALRPGDLRGRTVWRYAPFLPIGDPRWFVTLGEGLTPLLRLPRLGKRLGLRHLWLKFEGTNPTGTVKDRSTATAIAAAQEFGFNAVAVVSTGNAGSSIAAYGARAGLKTFVFCYEQAARPKMHHMAACATHFIVYRGGYDDLIRIYDRLMDALPIFEAGATRSTYKMEGKKTIAYETFEQLGNQAPDYFVAPVGVGETFIAAWRAFNELFAIGWAGKVPTMVAAQSSAANPIVEAWRDGGPIRPRRIGYTVAEGTAVGDPERKGAWSLDILREGKGLAADASDEEVLETQALLAQTEGIWAGPTGCVPLAALRKLAAARALDPDAVIVCVASESGLKGDSPAVPREAIEPDEARIGEILREGLAAG